MSDDELWHYCQGSDWTACGVEAHAGINTVRQIADGVNCRDCLIAHLDALTAATARQRAEAFLRTIGKWEEAK